MFSNVNDFRENDCFSMFNCVMKNIPTNILQHLVQKKKKTTPQHHWNRPKTHHHHCESPHKPTTSHPATHPDPLQIKPPSK